MNYLILSIIFGIIQISLWQSFPKWFVRWIFKIPLLAIIANIIASLLIMKIAGSSAFIGGCNLTGSVIFTGYVFMYNKLQTI